MIQHSTFMFADIAGFTALTEAHGDDDAADLALEFCRRVRERLAPADGEVVKTIGDALMIRMTAAAPAVVLGLEIVHDLMAEHGRPTVRIGMHEGPASERDGDFFGTAVNLAARIAGAAGGGEVLVSEPVRASAGSLHDVRFVSLGARRLRNVAAPIELYAAEPKAGVPAASALDPVCRMVVTPGRETRRVEHAGIGYLFCSEACAERFAAVPEAYVPAAPG